MSRPAAPSRATIWLLALIAGYLMAVGVLELADVGLILLDRKVPRG